MKISEISPGVTFIGMSLSDHDNYAQHERRCWQVVADQISCTFPRASNLLVSLTWFGPQFGEFQGWQQLLELEACQAKFDNLFLLATVDPPYLTVTEIQEIKNKVDALCVYLLGNFDGPHQFNFFAPVLAKHFQTYSDSELMLDDIRYVYVNYNRKPKSHRVCFVKKLIESQLDRVGAVTLGRDNTNHVYLSLGEQQQNYVGTTQEQFGLPMDYYTLHRMDVWKHAFLYINAATEFDPVNDLFCQQDTFKPMLGLRPFVINGVQRTYRWLRANGFRTFNHYWSHIPIEAGPVHDSLISLIKHLDAMPRSELKSMYDDMSPDLQYNRDRFYEFAKEQDQRLHNLFRQP